MINYLVGALLAFGGSMGYYKKGSIPSLLGGLVLGVAFIYSGYLQGQLSLSSQRTGVLIGTGASILLAFVGSMRFRAATKNGVAFPVLPLAFIALGALMLFLHVQRLSQRK